MTGPNRPIYDQYVKPGAAAAAAPAPDPIAGLFHPPPFTPPPKRLPDRAQVDRPPLLRQPGADAAGAPFKFTDAGPNAPVKGAPLQPGVEYKRINVAAGADVLDNDNKVGVARYDTSGRQPLQVDINSTMTRLDGRIFDTGDDKKMVPKQQQGAALLGAAEGIPFTVPTDWVDNAIMWVCVCPPGSDDVAFYSAVCKPEKVHHTSLGTDGVICAGEWIVRKGKLAKISANSGHFRPKIDALYRAILHLACARQGDSTIYLYDTKLKVWADVNWADFIAKPTGGGRYTTHPDSPMPVGV